MRRKEFEIIDDILIREFVSSQAVGSLALYDKSSRFPEIFPLNYVLYHDYIYMHTFSASLKVRIIKKDPNAVFSIFKEYSVVPSYFISENEKSIDQFYKSVIIKGEIEIIKDKHAKRQALYQLAKRFQPETEFVPDDLIDDNVIARTAVLRIPFVDYTAKFRFGQQYSDTELEKVSSCLLGRSALLDLETISEMKKFNSIK